MNNLIAQYWIGPYTDLVLESRDQVKAYAQRIGAESRFSTRYAYAGDNRTPYVHNGSYFEILRYVYDEKYDDYDNILFLDCDILINPNAPNVFASFRSYQQIAMCLEEPFGGTAQPWYFSENEYWKDMVRKYSMHGVEINEPHHSFRQYNTGVVLMSRAWRQDAREKYDDWKNWMTDYQDFHLFLSNDQSYINCMIMKYGHGVDNMGSMWNCNPLWYRPGSMGMYEGIPIENYHFYHFSDSSKKDALDWYRKTFKE
jgi:hypothetical protein